jgi:glutamate N-acetyltransferase/amino-acid N-acetyltransferase
MGESTFRVIDGDIASPKGYAAGAVACGIKNAAQERLDLGLLMSEVPATVAAVFTTNAVQAAPVKVTRQAVKSGKIQACVVNSGNANACTGRQGIEDAEEMCRLVAEHCQLAVEHIAVASTGVIGQMLPMDRIAKGIAKLPDAVGGNQGEAFSQAILTTDTVKKVVVVQVDVDGKVVTIAGTAKGSGMIHPNMATMLGFITTDADVAWDALRSALKTAVDDTFNMITVDGDTSTNDMVLVLANGLAGNRQLTEGHPDWQAFYQAFYYVMEELAKAIARDGEGATTLVEVVVNAARSCEDARKMAKAVVGSSLVKTAVYGRDANWGRVICAVGYSGAQVDPDKVSIWLGDIQVVDCGMPVPFDEAEAMAYLKQEHVVIAVDLHDGSHSARAWGCDLSYDYVKINASYRT